MNFDFTNYTFSAVIAVFAAIIGMAYPSIQSTIQELDEKYKSEGMVARFLKERQYTLFQVSLFLAVVFAILSPFVMMSFNRPSFLTLWMYLHSAVTLFLIICTIRLYQLMLIYKIPSDLLSYLGGGPERGGDSGNATPIAEIARYAADHNYTELYLKCTSHLYHSIQDQLVMDKLQFAPNMFFGTQPQESPLTKDMKDALTICTDINNNKEFKPLFQHDASLVVVLLTTGTTIRQGTYDVVWHIVSEAVCSGNKAWFKNYWTYASQHISSFDNRKYMLPFQSKEREAIDEEKRKYLEFHTAMGAMLIHYERYEWIKEILFYSMALPYKYPLCINTFGHFLIVWDDFQKYGDPVRFTMIQGFYPLYDLDEGVNQDNAILFVIEQYLALNFIRLWQLDYNVSYSNPLEKISPYKNIDKNSYWKKRLERLKYVVEYVYRESLNNCLGANTISVEEAVAYIDSNIQLLDDDTNAIYANPTIDEEKRTALITSIKKVWTETQLPFVTRPSSVFPARYSIVCEIPFNLQPSWILTGHEGCVDSNFGDVLMQGVNFLLRKVENRAFTSIKPIHTYNIDYNNIGEALRKLRLSKDFVILCNDFYASKYFNIIKCGEYSEADDGCKYFDNAEFIEFNIPATTSFLLILRKEELPYLTTDIKDIDGYTLIDEDTPVYTNIKTIGVDSLEDAGICVNTTLHYTDNLKYIKINLPYMLGKMDLNKIQHIESLI